MSYIYIAGPYTGTEEEQQARFEAHEAYAHYLLSQGIFCYSPIVHCHEIAKKYGLPKDFEYWQAYNTTMLRHAQELHILKLEGWEESKGTAFERGFAEACLIPVLLVDVQEREEEPIILGV